MKSKLKRILGYELSWFLALLAISAAAEYAVIVLFDLHPILSVKIQGIIGLLIFGYLIRMVSRLLRSFKDWFEPEEAEQNEMGSYGK
jgi:hypothetical protein